MIIRTWTYFYNGRSQWHSPIVIISSSSSIVLSKPWLYTLLDHMIKKIIPSDSIQPLWFSSNEIRWWLCEEMNDQESIPSDIIQQLWFLATTFTNKQSLLLISYKYIYFCNLKLQIKDMFDLSWIVEYGWPYSSSSHRVRWYMSLSTLMLLLIRFHCNSW